MALSLKEALSDWEKLKKRVLLVGTRRDGRQRNRQKMLDEIYDLHKMIVLRIVDIEAERHTLAKEVHDFDDDKEIKSLLAARSKLVVGLNKELLDFQVDFVRESDQLELFLDVCRRAAKAAAKDKNPDPKERKLGLWPALIDDIEKVIDKYFYKPEAGEVDWRKFDRSEISNVAKEDLGREFNTRAKAKINADVQQLQQLLNVRSLAPRMDRLNRALAEVRALASGGDGAQDSVEARRGEAAKRIAEMEKVVSEMAKALALYANVDVEAMKKSEHKETKADGLALEKARKTHERMCETLDLAKAVKF